MKFLGSQEETAAAESAIEEEAGADGFERLRQRRNRNGNGRCGWQRTEREPGGAKRRILHRGCGSRLTGPV